MRAFLSEEAFPREETFRYTFWGFPSIGRESPSDQPTVKVTATHGSPSGLLGNQLNVSGHPRTTRHLKKDMEDKDTKKASGERNVEK